MESLKNLVWNGDFFWDTYILDGLNTVSLEHENYKIYNKAPASLYASLVETQKKYPTKNCIVDDSGISYTYTQFLELVEDFSKVLSHRYNICSSDRIGLLLHNSIEFCVSFYAINRLNAITVPLSTKYTKNETSGLIKKAKLDGIILEENFSEWFEEISFPFFRFFICVSSGSTNYSLPRSYSTDVLEDITAAQEDTAIIMFTSGTTSQSKGVPLTNYNTMHAVFVYQKIFKIVNYDSTIIPVPIYHVTGLLALLGLFIASGGCIYLHRVFDARRVLAEVIHQKITFLHAAPTVFSLLLEHRHEYPALPSLRLMACGSSNMPKPKILALKEWIPHAEFRTVYGLTETSSPAAILPEDASKCPYIGSSGHPIPGTQFKICNDSATELPPNTIGSIFIKGSVVTPGYLTGEDNVIENGWLDTGDLGYFNKYGFLYIVDRKKDMINRGGEKICSIDVENALYKIPGITQAAVVGIPDSTYGEVPAGMVTLKKDSLLTSKAIQVILKTELAKFQIPVKLFITDCIPLTPNSKIDKKEVRRFLSENL